MSRDLIIQAIVSGILMGLIYALVAVGLSLIFGLMEIVNFAHGEFLMAAMYATYWLQALLGWDPYVSVALVLPASFLFGLAVERLVIRPSIGKPHLVVVFATMGLSVLMQNLALFLWRGDYRQAALLTEVAEAVDRDSEYEAEDADYDVDDGGDAAYDERRESP